MVKLCNVWVAPLADSKKLPQEAREPVLSTMPLYGVEQQQVWWEGTSPQVTSVFCSNQLCGVVGKDLSSHKAWCRGQARGQCHRPVCRLLHITMLHSGTEFVAVTWVAPRARHCSQHCMHGDSPKLRKPSPFSASFSTHSDFTHHRGHKREGHGAEARASEP